MEAWAAAKEVVISGVIGRNATMINGRYEQIEREVYRKVGQPGTWLFVAKDNRWMVGPTANKDVRKTHSSGWAYARVPASGMPPPAGSGLWKVSNGNGWVEQAVEVEVHAMQVRKAQQVSAVPSPSSPVFPPLAGGLTSLTTFAHAEQLQVEAAWGAAQQVVISSATGPNAATINGQFELVEREVYCKVGEPDKWLFVAKDGDWTVGNTLNKDARATDSNGWAYAVVEAGGMPPHSGSVQWNLHNGTAFVEQTVKVEVLSVAQVRQNSARKALAVHKAQQVGACGLGHPAPAGPVYFK